MRSKSIDRLFRETITSKMAARLPDFIWQGPTKTTGSDLVFRSSLLDFCHCYAIFQFSDRSSDAFTVEFAWKPDATWNYDVLLDIPVDIPRSQIVAARPVEGKFRFRLTFLRPPYNDIWWTLTPEPTFEENMDYLGGLEPPAVTPLSPVQIETMNDLVDDAILLIETKAIPMSFSFQ